MAHEEDFIGSKHGDRGGREVNREPRQPVARKPPYRAVSRISEDFILCRTPAAQPSAGRKSSAYLGDRSRAAVTEQTIRLPTGISYGVRCEEASGAQPRRCGPPRATHPTHPPRPPHGGPWW